VAPESIGNRRKLLVSDQAGRANVLAELERIGIKVDKDDPRITRLLEEVKNREAMGYAYESADASFDVLARRMMGRPRSSGSTHARQAGSPYVIMPRHSLETFTPARPRFL